MKIMQVNVWQGHILKPLLTLIEAENPDIIFAQEIFSYPAPVSSISPWKQFRTLELIAAQNHFEHVFFSPASSFTLFDQELNFGNAIFSKFPFTHTSTHHTKSNGPHHYNDPAEFDGNTGRNFQHVQIDTGKTQLNLINHHAHWIANPHGDEVSTERLLKVADYIQNLEGPVIAGGDFNLSPDSTTIRTFLEAVKLHDIVAETGATTTLSAAHYIQNIVCDYLLASPSLEVGRVEVSDALVSDHKAVIAEFNC